MLVELVVRDLGVIADISLLLGPGMTALTGETGAGKTLLVEAIELLLGSRADADLVRAGAEEASVEGRFVRPSDEGEDEMVLGRAIPAEGRSRAYVDGRPAPASLLAERGAALVDLHGQHAHQSLLAAGAQREALDRFGAIDLASLVAARDRVRDVERALHALGGDERARAREVDLLRHQLGEIDRAALAGPDEDAALEAEEDRLADAAAHRHAASAAHAALTDDGGAADSIGMAVAALTGRRPFGDQEGRLRALAAEVSDVAADVRAAGEGIDEDPARLEEVRARRRLVRELQRKYGDGLASVMAYADEARGRLAELLSHEARASELEAERGASRAEATRAAALVGAARRAAAPRLAAAVEARLQELALAGARFMVAVGDDDPGEDVTFLFGANTGEPLLPLARVASGGELSRVMLGLRLVLGGGAPTLVFDEVDAGIGGEAAVAVGEALAALGAHHQVLVVTHLPQVAAFADRQVAVAKEEVAGRTLARVSPVEGADRVIELSRMLSGQPASRTARGHASELLAAAARTRAGTQKRPS